MTTRTRFIIITTDTNEKIIFAYDTACAAPKTVSDSYALHLALTAIDPGDEYTVKFTNQRPRRGKNVWFEELPR